MSTKHTTGPWRVANGVQIRSHRDQIAKVWMMRNGEGNANARLIAAAPELLAVLQEIIEADDEAAMQLEAIGCLSDEVVALTNKARAVVAKATGEA